MPTETLRIGSLSAERWSGVSPNSLSEQCKISVRPVDLGLYEWEESYSLSGFDYVNGTGVVGETSYPEVDHTMSNGVFLVSPDQINGILHAIARIHNDPATLDKVEITIPYTVDDNLAAMESVKVHDAGKPSGTAATARMENMISPHQVVTGFNMPSEVCAPFAEGTELDDVVIDIPEAGTPSPALRLDVTEYFKSTGSVNLAMGLYLEVEVVDPNGGTPSDDTKVVFDGTQAGVMFRHTETPKVLEVLEVSTQRFRSNMTFGSDGAVLFVDRDAGEATIGVDYDVTAGAGALVTPPFFKKEHIPGDPLTDPITGLPLPEFSAWVEYPKTGDRTPSAYFGRAYAGSDTIIFGQGGTPLPDPNWNDFTTTDPIVHIKGADDLTIIDFVEPSYDPVSPVITYTTSLPKLYSSAGHPQGRWRWG